jgi:hypothetical protein
VPIDVSASALSLAGDAGLTTGGGASVSSVSAGRPSTSTERRRISVRLTETRSPSTTSSSAPGD